MTDTSVSWNAGSGGVAPAWPWLVAAAVLIAGAVACLDSPLLGIAVLVLPAVPLLVGAPGLALLALIAALPFDAVASLVESHTLTLTRVLGVAVLGGWVLHVAWHGRTIRLGSPGLLILAYVAFAAASIGWASDTDVTLTALRTLAQLFFLYLMAANVLDDWQRISRALDVLLLSTAILAVLVLLQVEAGHARTVLRYGTQAFNPNALAAQLALPAAAALAFRVGGHPLGWWRWAAVVPIALALLATGSRGGATAFVAGLAVLAIGRPRLGVGAVAALTVAALLTPAVLPRDSIERLRTRWMGTTQDRLSGRLDIWRVGFAMIADRPLHGTGFAGFRDAFYGYMLETRVDPHFALAHSRGNRAAHNIYVSTFAELGLAGGALLGVAFAAHARRLLQMRRAARAMGHARAEDVSLALLACLATILVAGLCTDLLLVKTPWLLLAAMQGAAIAAGWDGTREAVG
jgi:O-antigen ligase